MKNLAFIAAMTLLGLAACNSEVEEPAPPTEQAAAIEEQAASIELQPILYPDIEANNLYGASCAYAEGTSMAALVIAMQDAAFIKSDGELITLSARAPSEELPYGSRAEYFSENYTLSLKIEGEGALDSPEVVNYSGTAVLSDTSGAELQRFSGTTQCGV